MKGAMQMRFNPQIEHLMRSSSNSGSKASLGAKCWFESNATCFSQKRHLRREIYLRKKVMKEEKSEKLFHFWF